MLAIGLSTVVLILVAFAALGWWSAHGAASRAGMHNERLNACGAAPNCVCSESQNGADPAHAVAPLALPDGEPAAQWQTVRSVVTSMGGLIIDERDAYLHATMTSPMFRFVDDLELRREGTVIHLRSASRVGYSDLGANRKRVEDLKRRVREALDAG